MARGGSTRRTGGPPGAVDQMMQLVQKRIAEIHQETIATALDLQNQVVYAQRMLVNAQEALQTHTNTTSARFLELYGTISLLRNQFNSVAQQQISSVGFNAGTALQPDLQAMNREARSMSRDQREIAAEVAAATSQPSASVARTKADLPMVIPHASVPNTVWFRILKEVLETLDLAARSNELQSYVTTEHAKLEKLYKVTKTTIYRKISTERKRRADYLAANAPTSSSTAATSSSSTSSTNTSSISTTTPIVIPPPVLKTNGGQRLFTEDMLVSIIREMGADQLVDQSWNHATVEAKVDALVKHKQRTENKPETGLSTQSMSIALNLIKTLTTTTLKADKATSTVARQIAMADYRNRLANVAMLLALRFGKNEFVNDEEGLKTPTQLMLIWNYDDTTHNISFGLGGHLTVHYAPSLFARHKIKAKAESSRGGLPTNVKVGVLGFADGYCLHLYYLKIKEEHWDVSAKDEQGTMLHSSVRFGVIQSGIPGKVFRVCAYRNGTPENIKARRVADEFILPEVLKRQISSGEGKTLATLNMVTQRTCGTIDGATPVLNAFDDMYKDGTLRRHLLTLGKHSASASGACQPMDLMSCFRTDKKSIKSCTQDQARLRELNSMKELSDDIQPSAWLAQDRLRALASSAIPTNTKSLEKRLGIKITKRPLVMGLFYIHLESRERCYSVAQVKAGWVLTGINYDSMVPLVYLNTAMNKCQTWTSMTNEQRDQIKKDMLTVIYPQFVAESQLSDKFCNEQKYPPSAYDNYHNEIIFREDKPKHQQRATLRHGAAMLERVRVANAIATQIEEDFAFARNLDGESIFDHYFQETHTYKPLLEGVHSSKRLVTHLKAALFYCNESTVHLLKKDMEILVQKWLDYANDAAIDQHGLDTDDEDSSNSDDDLSIGEMLAATSLQEDAMEVEEVEEVEEEEEEEEEIEDQTAMEYSSYVSGGGFLDFFDWHGRVGMDEIVDEPGTIKCDICNQWRRFPATACDYIASIDIWTCSLIYWDEQYSDCTALQDPTIIEEWEAAEAAETAAQVEVP